MGQQAVQHRLRQFQQPEQGRCRFELAFHHPVEHAFKGPGIFAGYHRAGKTATAFQGVIGASQGFQGLVVFGVRPPGVQTVGHGAQHLVRFFEEDFEDLFVDVRFEVGSEFLIGAFGFSCRGRLVDGVFRNGICCCYVVADDIEICRLGGFGFSILP